jgi:hypothetical protein
MIRSGHSAFSDRSLNAPPAPRPSRRPAPPARACADPGPRKASLIPTCGPRLSQVNLLARSAAPLWAAARPGLTPAPVARVHDPSGVATRGMALWSAGHSRFRSSRVVMALLVACPRPIPRHSLGAPAPSGAASPPWPGPVVGITHRSSGCSPVCRRSLRAPEGRVRLILAPPQTAQRTPARRLSTARNQRRSAQW